MHSPIGVVCHSGLVKVEHAIRLNSETPARDMHMRQQL
jgi:hypothetical protein